MIVSTRKRDTFGFAVFLALCLAVSAIGGAVTTVVFWQREGIAGMLFLPYAAWVAFAAVLNAALWQLN